MERLAEEIRRRAGEAGPRLTALRRHLHRHPEPAWGEYLTASLVARALQDAGFRLTLGANALRPSARPRQPEAAFCTAQSGRALNEGADPTLVACMAGGLTGLWGDLDLDSPGTPEDERGPLVAFRFDMDANAGITEATDKDHFPAAQGFASCHAGCMHACGHDGHVALGVEFCRKYREKEDIIHAIQAHHNDVECKTLVACLVQAADAISAARPGARRENLENYIKRLEKLEEITGSYPGVEKSYAIQAGREVRVMVKPEQVSEDQMVILARELAKRIENELEYPGQIKVHVLRETKVVEYAK